MYIVNIVIICTDVLYVLQMGHDTQKISNLFLDHCLDKGSKVCFFKNLKNSLTTFCFEPYHLLSIATSPMILLSASIP